MTGKKVFDEFFSARTSEGGESRRQVAEIRHSQLARAGAAQRGRGALPHLLEVSLLPIVHNRDSQLATLCFFVALAFHQQVLDGFDQHFQASVHFPIASAIDKAQQHQNEFLGMPRIKPGAAG